MNNTKYVPNRARIRCGRFGVVSATQPEIAHFHLCVALCCVTKETKKEDDDEEKDEEEDGDEGRQ